MSRIIIIFKIIFIIIFQAGIYLGFHVKIQDFVCIRCLILFLFLAFSHVSKNYFLNALLLAVYFAFPTLYLFVILLLISVQ